MDLNRNQSWHVLYDYIPVYEIWIQYTNVFKRYRQETIFHTEIKGHNSDNNRWILSVIKLDLYFMIIYLCMKYESNMSLSSKDIARKPFFIQRSRAITLIIISGFYPWWNLTCILWIYTCVRNMNPTHQCIQKISPGNRFHSEIKGHNSDNNLWILSIIELDLNFMNIYLCMKYESNTPMYSKSPGNRFSFGNQGP